MKSKLKFSDDYRGKIIHNKDKFKNKLHNKICKEKIKYVPIKSGEKYNINKTQFIARINKDLNLSNNDLSIVKNKEIDISLKEVNSNEFIDNNSIENNYIDNFTEKDNINNSTEKNELNNSKTKNKKSNIHKRKNYSDKLYTRNKENTTNTISDNNFNSKDNNKSDNKSNNNKTNNKTFSNKLKNDKTNNNKTNNKTLNKTNVNSIVLTGIAKTGEQTSNYLSYGIPYGSDENTGVESAEKIINTSSKLVHSAKSYSNKRRLKKINDKKYKLQNHKSKLEFKKAKTEVNRAKNFKKFQKKKQMKSYITNKNKAKNIRKSISNTLKVIREIVLKKAKGYALLVVLIIIIGTFIINFANISIMGLINSTSGVLTTTYLSDENMLNEVNNHFFNMEEILQNEIDSVKYRFPNYDEYILESNGEIGHNTHQLLAYITSRCGEIKDFSQVKGIIDELFEKMYSISYREEIEIRYHTVIENHTDENGNEYTETYQVPYEYKKLITVLDKKDMDTVIREILKDYPDNLTHYEVLLETQGNMSDIFGSNDLSEIVQNPNFNNPNIEFTEEQAKVLFNEAEKHIGKRYVFGANGPANFDCSSFVCWSFTRSGVKNMPRTTAWGIYKNYCDPISPSEAKAGDIIFFKNTYNSTNPISHVGIYAGNGMMLHAGDPIQYTSINTNYWKNHFYGFGRIK